MLYFVLMIANFVLLFLALLAYGYLWRFLQTGLNNVNGQVVLESKGDLKDLAVLIPHKNDTAVLPQLLDCLDKIDHGLSVYIVDDYSDPSNAETLRGLAESYPIKLISNEANPGKKGAIAFALEQINEQNILQLDADVVPADNLFHELSKVWTNSTQLTIAAIRMKPVSNFWSELAALDHLALQLSTFASAANHTPIMASGACMLYQKNSFLKYSRIGENWQSGDDTFFAQALAKDDANAISYNPMAFSTTMAPTSFKAFIKQRLRWGAKTPAYPSSKAKIIALIVAFINGYLIFGTLATLTGSMNVFFLAFFWVLKAWGDYHLLRAYAQRTGEIDLLKGYPLKALAYPFYISLVVMLIPFAPKQRWLKA